MHRVLLALLACAWAGVAAAAPLAAYSKLPEFEAAAISPSGHAVATVVTNGEQRVIMVRDLKSGKLISQTATGDVKVRQVRWADDRRLLVVTSVTAAPIDLIGAKREWYMGFIVDLQTQKIMPMLRDVQHAMNTIFDVPVVRTVKGEPMVFVQGMRVAGRGRLSLYRIDLDNARSKLVGEGGDNTRDWVVGVDGEPLAQELYDAKSGLWLMRMRTPGVGWREVMSAKATLDPPYMISQGRSPGSVLYSAPDGQDRWFWREANLDAAVTPPPPIEFSGEQGVILSPSDGRLIGISLRRGDDVAIDFFDPVDARNWRAVQAAFPGDRLTLESWSYDRRKIIVSVDSPREGPAYALVDIDTREAKWLGSSYADLKRQVTYSRAMGGIASQRYWLRFLGADDPNAPILAERSPARHVETIKVPILLIHGQDDTVVHPEQSRIMAEALRRAGKPVELVMQKGADHWLSRGDTRLQTLESLMAFVEKHNPPN